MAESKEWYEEAATAENEYVRAVILKGDHPQHDQALKVAERARDMARSALGQDHPAYAEALQNLGVYYSAIEKDANKADDFFGQARAVVGRDHVILARSYYFLGMFWYEARDPKQAETFFSEALAIQRHALTAHDPALAQTLVCLALAKAALEGPGAALALLEEALEIQRAGLPAKDPQILETEQIFNDMSKRAGAK